MKPSEQKKKLNTRKIKSVRQQLLRLENTGWNRARCYYCKEEFEGILLTLEHVVPVSEGGDTSVENCVLACSPCNGYRASNPLGSYVCGKSPWILPLMMDDPKGILRHDFQWKINGANLAIHMITPIDAGNINEGTVCGYLNNKGDLYSKFIWHLRSTSRPGAVTCGKCLRRMMRHGYIPAAWQEGIANPPMLWFDTEQVSVRGRVIAQSIVDPHA